MFYIIYLAAAAILLILVLRAEKKDSIRGVLVVKPVLSAMFIILALLQPHAEGLYFPLVLTGLSFCLVGDICLVFFFKKKIFMLGLVAFLIGHVFYFVSFFGIAGFNIGTLVSLVAIVFISGFIFIKLKPHLGSMLGPVIAYLLIISLMVAGAATVFADNTISLTGRVMVLLAAIIFYCSDIFVARHRFVKKEMTNRYFSLPMYYTAQFILAFSVGMIQLT